VSLQRNLGVLDYNYAYSPYTVNDRDEYIAIMKWDHDLTPNFSYYVKAYLRTWWTYYTRQNYDLSYADYKNIWGFEDWGINILNSYVTDNNHEILVGLDYQNYWGKDYSVTIRAQHAQVYALFAQYRPNITFWDGFKMAFGARYNYSADANSLIWNASAYAPIMANDALYFKTSIGTSFILPTAAELYADEPNRHGNPSLRPQEGFTALASIGTKQRIFDFELEGFYQKMTDRIERDLTSTYQNFEGDSIITGFTVSTNVRLTEGLVFGGSYTAQSYEQNRKGVKSNILADMSKNIIKLNLQWDGKFDEYRYGAGIYSVYKGDTNLLLGGRYVNSGDYWLVDFKAYFCPSERIMFNLTLENLFDQVYGYNMVDIIDPSAPGGRYPIPSNLGMPFNLVLTASYKF
jgi:outer membrane cobalamin receptor